MSDKISLTASMRSNLLSLQNTQKLFESVQDRLATGKKVNSALDNPNSFFSAASLNNRANDLNSLMDSMGQGVQTLKAADQGIQTLTKLAEQAKSLVNTALDSSVVKTNVAGTLRIDVYDEDTRGIMEVDGITSGDKFIIRSGSANEITSDVSKVFSESTKIGKIDSDVDSTAELAMQINISGTWHDVDLSSMTAGAVTVKDIADAISAIDGVTAKVEDGKLVVTADDPNDYITFADGGTAASATAGTLATALGLNTQNVEITINSADTLTSADLVSKINSRAASEGVDITASLVDGKLKISDNLGNDLVISDMGSGTSADTLGITGDDRTGANLRAEYASQFDSLRTQINELVQDTGYKGVNLLKGDNLTVNFNESRTSKLNITGVTFDALGLGITATENNWKTNDDIQSQLTQVESALTTLRSQASTFGNNLTVVQTREDFTKGMVDTLTAGADKLVLADMNEEAANMLALQTRQQLGTNSLSLASQSAQGVLRLF